MQIKRKVPTTKLSLTSTFRFRILAEHKVDGLFALRAVVVGYTFGHLTNFVHEILVVAGKKNHRICRAKKQKYPIFSPDALLPPKLDGPPDALPADH
jgi:hypothetical protein